LRLAAQEANSAAAHLRLGDFYLERKRWAEAAAAYGRAIDRGKTDPLPRYLRGVALARAGQGKEAKALVEQARLLPRADDERRSSLAEGLAQRGLADEAAAERSLSVRTAPFRSIYTSNALASLGSRRARQGRYLEAARCYRRIYLNLALGSGGA